jgi:SAM-dependent methyltransferase
MPLSGEQRLALRRRWYRQAEERVFGTLGRALDQHIQQGACVLDAGSGGGTWVLRRRAGRVRLLVSADIEPPAQQGVAVPAVADLAQLPFADAAFNVILCYNVIEHLAQPERTLREFSRLLAPGGALIFKTPNLTAPITLASHLTPVSVRRFVKSRLNVNAEQVFPTYYGCNTPGALQSGLQAAGLQREVLLVADQTYDYLFFSRLTYVLGLLYSRVVGLPLLSPLRNTIIGVYVKG